MSMGRMTDRQNDLWVATDEIRTPGHFFYERLNQVFAEHDFDRQAEALCRSHYADGEGRKSIPPGRYFRMLMVGYYEGIASEREIAWRCADSLSLKSFLGVGPADVTPEHSSLSVIRRRLPIEVFRKVNKMVLEVLKKGGLLRGRALAFDSTTMEANAAMRGIVRRDTNESYAGYVERLAKAAGDAAPTRGSRARFDRKRRGRTTSNEDWVSPVDPEAKVTKMKDGRTHLAYKPEHAVDLESGAIVAATVNPANESDHATSTETLVRTIENLEHLGSSTVGFTVVGDKGYHSENVIAGCVTAELKTCISEPKLRGRRNLRDKSPLARRALERNRRRVRSEYGKRLLKKRGETVERSFAHLHETGGMRRTWLRGRENIEKRYLVQVSAFNLGLVMRKMIGFGTPKGLGSVVSALVRVVLALLHILTGTWRACSSRIHRA
jgi:transposase